MGYCCEALEPDLEVEPEVVEVAAAVAEFVAPVELVEPVEPVEPVELEPVAAVAEPAEVDSTLVTDLAGHPELEKPWCYSRS